MSSIIRDNVSYSVPDYLLSSFIGNICDESQTLVDLASDNADNIPEGLYLELMNIAGRMRRHIESRRLEDEIDMSNTDTQYTQDTQDTQDNISVIDDFIVNNVLARRGTLRIINVIYNNTNVTSYDTKLILIEMMKYISMCMTGLHTSQISEYNRDIDSLLFTSQFIFTYKNKHTDYSQTFTYVLPSLQASVHSIRYNNSNRHIETYIERFVLFLRENNDLRQIMLLNMCNMLIPFDIYDELTYDNEDLTGRALQDIVKMGTFIQENLVDSMEELLSHSNNHVYRMQSNEIIEAINDSTTPVRLHTDMHYRTPSFPLNVINTDEYSLELNYEVKFYDISQTQLIRSNN